MSDKHWMHICAGLVQLALKINPAFEDGHGVTHNRRGYECQATSPTIECHTIGAGALCSDDDYDIGWKAFEFDAGKEEDLQRITIDTHMLKQELGDLPEMPGVRVSLEAAQLKDRSRLEKLQEEYPVNAAGEVILVRHLRLSAPFCDVGKPGKNWHVSEEGGLVCIRLKDMQIMMIAKSANDDDSTAEEFEGGDDEFE